MKPLSIFTRNIRMLARQIPAGRVTTYGALAKAAGGGGQAARSVASILNKDPHSHEIPFHRIVFSNGKISCGGVATSYNNQRAKAYTQEDIQITPANKIKDFEELLYRFDE